MIFTETKLKDAFIIEPEKIQDERGFFARTWDKSLFKKRGLETNVSQCSISYNIKKGTIRGMHFQLFPYEETKIVTCVRGKIFDVIVDLRKESKTYKNWFGIELSEFNHKHLYIPPKFAHGFQTLENDTIISYMISEFYNPEKSSGFRWDDPSISIQWPLKVTNMSERDKNFPNYD